MLPLVEMRSVLTAADRVRSLRIRTITAGVGLTRLTELKPIEEAIGVLERAKKVFEAEGYEVQTIRVATPPLLADATAGLGKPRRVGSSRWMSSLSGVTFE